MYLLDVVAYFAVLTSLTIAPGPLSAILVAKTLSGDKAGALAFGMGIAIGDTLIIVLICGGIASWLESSTLIFSFGKFIAALYIIWIAYGILRNKQTIVKNQRPNSGKRLAELSSGMLTCIASPQTLLLYLVLVPRIINLDNITLIPLIILLVTTFAALITSLLLLILLSGYIRAWVGPRSNTSIGDWILATVVAGSGLAIVAF
ncbi:hypothetical protein AB833_10535 [Chromatiales bacterium (ex Bugula neritina AB1)]|nr:hypothetical protein AB833_10535 [Chromatiales bacterium (ex Bugula neritina AB1)]